MRWAGQPPLVAELNQAEMEAWGEQIGREVERPAVLALRGDLGAGKSTLARAIARGAGVRGPVPSPTFNLLFRYQTPLGVLLHFDLYRLHDPEQVWELGWEEIGAPGELVLVEWPERAEGLLPRERWDLWLGETADAGRRRVLAGAGGEPAALPWPAAVG